ncbi:MAG: hypothetical protein QNJ00_12820 [Woeseiaceae bacterium]|nr:hypothetical protein [Woeseiaceae bacterium]
MHRSVKAAIRAINGRLTATLLLSLCCAPVSAASGVDVLCDRSDPLASLDIQPGQLAIDIVDHGAAPALPNVLIETESEGGEPPETDARSLAPRADTILRRIFDESYAESELDDLKPAMTPDAKSIVELTVPIDEEAADAESVEAPALDAELPGVPEEELLRYRRQMFRTDI